LIELRPAQEADLDECLAFLKPREYRSAGLTSRLLRVGKPALPPSTEARLWILRDRGNGAEGIMAAFLVANTRMVYHCVREGFDLGLASRLLNRAFLSDGIACAVGNAEGTEALERLVGKAPRHGADYELMTLEAAPGTPLPPPGAEIVRVGPEDLDFVYPLQSGYEREEVLLPGEPFSPVRCRSLLRATLASQLVFAAKRDSLAAAKAGTNARGFDWDQIGGVYTLPSLRGQGLGKAVFAELCANRLRDGRKLSLFVKTENIPAKNLYLTTGFATRERFRIAYW